MVEAQERHTECRNGGNDGLLASVSKSRGSGQCHRYLCQTPLPTCTLCASTDSQGFQSKRLEQIGIARIQGNGVECETVYEADNTRVFKTYHVGSSLAMVLVGKLIV